MRDSNNQAMASSGQLGMHCSQTRQRWAIEVELPGGRPAAQGAAGQTWYRCRSNAALAVEADFALGPGQLQTRPSSHSSARGQLVDVTGEFNNHRCRSGWCDLARRILAAMS